MKRVWFYLLLLTLSFGNANAGSAVENALISDTQYTLMGTFGKHDFAGADKAFDWAFTMLSSGKSYQLQGISPSDNDVFGWKEVNIATPTPDWYMFQLNGDVDGDGSIKFDWVLVSTDMNSKEAYKLAGVAANGTFEYSSELNIHYEVTDNMIQTGKVTVQSDDVEDGAYLNVKHGADSSFSGDSRGKNISPHLKWTSVPGVQSYALEMIDLDYQNSQHWAVINIPASTTSLPQSVTSDYQGMQSLTNAYGVSGYTGPFPPNTHRYQFTVYAVNKADVLTMSEAKENAIDSAAITPKFKW